jgi:hypothetical protein
MKYSIVLAAVVAVASAQSLDISQIPPCALGCATSLLAESTCADVGLTSPDLPACLCKDADFQEKFSECAKTTGECTEAEQCTLYTFSKDFCPTLSVDDPCPAAGRPVTSEAPVEAPVATETVSVAPTATETVSVAPTATETVSVAPTATETVSVAPTATETVIGTTVVASGTASASASSPAFTGAANSLAVNAGAALVGVAAFFAL